MMLKILRTSAAVAALALSATPAFAAPAEPNQNATATARIIRPLTLTYVQDLNFGTILLSGAGVWTGATVSVSQTGARTCTNTNVTCSGASQAAEYNVTGTNNQTVTITVDDVTLVNQNDATETLLMTVDSPGTLDLTNSGSPGDNFNLGGSITVNSDTVDGVYLGTFDVTVDY